MNESTDMNIKTWKHPVTSSTNSLDHLEPSLRKEPDKVLIHSGTNGLTKYHHHLNNMKKIVKMIIQKCKDTKLGFSLLICKTGLKDVDEKVIKTNHIWKTIGSIKNSILLMVLISGNLIWTLEDCICKIVAKIN